MASSQSTAACIPPIMRVCAWVSGMPADPATPDNTINWVLGRFNAAQRKQLPEFLADGADAAETIVFEGLTKAQDKFNAR